MISKWLRDGPPSTKKNTTSVGLRSSNRQLLDTHSSTLLVTMVTKLSRKFNYEHLFSRRSFHFILFANRLHLICLKCVCEQHFWWVKREIGFLIEPVFDRFPIHAAVMTFNCFSAQWNILLQRTAFAFYATQRFGLTRTTSTSSVKETLSRSLTPSA